jgi:hypothetical protein
VSKNLTKVELTKLAYSTYKKIAESDLFITDWEYLLANERLAWFEVVLVLGEAFRQARDFDSNGLPKGKVRRDERDPWEGQEEQSLIRAITVPVLKFNDESDYLKKETKFYD